MMKKENAAQEYYIKQNYMKKSLSTGINVLCIVIFFLTVFSCGKDDDSDAGQSTNEDDHSYVKSSEKRITDFSFEPIVNTGLTGMHHGYFNNDSSTITIATQLWINNIEALKPSFKAVGVVTVNNVEQRSSVSAQNFTKEVVYVVTAEDGSTRSYTVVFESPQASGLPVIKIDTEERKSIENKFDYINANVEVCDYDNKAHCLKATAGIRGRGNSTWHMPKKPYRLKFDEKTSLFGLPKEKSWVLLANYQDPTAIMNSVAFELGHRFGLPYTNHDKHVELFLNGAYQGSYTLTEQVQVKSGRVNISETEGFLVEIDQYYDEEPKFRTNILSLPVMIKSPSLEDYPSLNLNFVREAINELEYAMFDEAGGFPDNNYKELIDIDNVIDFIMINELMRNVEVKHPKSIFMYKDKNERIKFGPLWDFDWVFGYEDGWSIYFHMSRAGTVLMRPFYTWDGNIGHKFFCRFFDDPEFCKKYKARWKELYASQISTMNKFMTEMGNKLEISQKQNSILWGHKNYQAEIRGMISFWDERIKLLNNQINDYDK